MTLDQEFAAFAVTLEKDEARLRERRLLLHEDVAVGVVRSLSLPALSLGMERDRLHYEE